MDIHTINPLILFDVFCKTGQITPLFLAFAPAPRKPLFPAPAQAWAQICFR
jgi:hypothetical protein